MKALLNILLTLLFACNHVQAGSRICESSLSYSRSSNNPKLTSRWLHFGPQRTSTNLWPNKRIPLCYGNLDAENALAPYINAAMELWYAAGLPQTYKVERAHHLQCTMLMANTLWVYHGHSLATPVGMRTIEHGKPASYSVLEISYEELGNPASNIAHELGHAFGLYHEQQNPAAWAPNHLDKLFRFRCENLTDFSQKTRNLEQFEIWGAEGVCRNLYRAAWLGFSAHNCLPYMDAVSKYGSYMTENDIDWDSIMLLPSSVGRNHRGIPIAWKDGSVIGENRVPSAEDVEGIRHLYEGRAAFREELLLNDLRSEHFGLFREYAPGCIH